MNLLHFIEEVPTEQSCCEYFNEKCIVFSGNITGCLDNYQPIETHITAKSDRKTTRTTLNWVHIAIIGSTGRDLFCKH